jgi:uncharacterized membrane protein
MLFYILALGSGVFRTFSVGFDFISLSIMTIDPIVFGFMSQWVSFLAVLTLLLFLSIPKKLNEKPRALGYRLDPDFGRIGFIPRKPMLYVLGVGFFAGIATTTYYFMIGFTDASSVLPYGQLVIVYLLIGDLFAEKDTPTIIEVQSITSVLVGVLLVGVKPGGFDLLTLALVLIPMNISSGFVTFFQRKAKRYEIRPGLKVDSLNIRLWSLLVLNIVYSIFAYFLTASEKWTQLLTSFLPLFWFMVGSSVATFLSLVFYVRALGRGSMSVVNSLSAISVVLGIPLTLIGNFFLPGAFGGLSGDVFLWMIRIFGVILVMIGVVALQAADIRSIVTVRLKKQTGDILPKLFDIKGVESAAAIAGPYDYILSIKSRSLGKTRSNILNKIHMIPEVSDVKTMIVLRDFR